MTRNVAGVGNVAAPRLWTRSFALLTLAELLYFTAGGMIIVAVPFYVIGPLGRGSFAAGVATGVFSVVALVLRPWAGGLADRIGRRRLLLGGASLAGVATATLAVAHDYWVLVALRAALGAAEALFFVAALAALADLAPPGRIAEALSYNSVALYMGLAIGPVLAQATRERGYGAVWLTAAALLAVTVAMLLTVPETAPDLDPEDRAEPTGRRLLHPAAVLPGLALVAGVGATAGFLAFGGPHAEQSGMARWSLPLFVYGALVVVFRVTLARFFDRGPPAGLATASLLTCAVGLGAYGLARAPALLVLSAATVALGITLLTPVVFGAVFSAVPARERGAAAGTLSMAIDLGLGGGPMLAGAAAGLMAPGGAFVAGSALCLLGLLAARRLPSAASTG